MQIVLLSGGAGKRLWPLSNDLYSKQFLRLLRRADGTRESMIQRVCRQVREAAPGVPITIATAGTQISLIRRQLGTDVSISVEPCRRDTFPAIALVCAYLHEVRGVPLTESVAICPADPYVASDYFRAVTDLLTEVEREGAAPLLLMGIEPTYPSEKYGYILPETGETQSKVASFREKPDEATAEKYIAEGALWNSGIFAFRLGYVLGKMQEVFPFDGYEDLYNRYEDLPKISFDYAVAEKEENIAVRRYSGTWLDIGTWNTLAGVMPEDTIGRVTLDETCSNDHAVNTASMPILCMGLKNVVVAASPEGILIADKHRSSMMKPYVEKLHTPVMYTEKSWGRVPHPRRRYEQPHHQDHPQPRTCSHLPHARTPRRNMDRHRRPRPRQTRRQRIRRLRRTNRPHPPRLLPHHPRRNPAQGHGSAGRRGYRCRG